MHPCRRAAGDGDVEVFRVAGYLENRTRGAPTPGSDGGIVRGHIAPVLVIRPRERDRAHAAGSKLRELEVEPDAVFVSGTGVHRLPEGEGGGAVGRLVGVDQKGVEGVVAAVDLGAAGLDDAVGRLTDLVRHHPGTDGAGKAKIFEAAVRQDGIDARRGCCCGCCRRD